MKSAAAMRRALSQAGGVQMDAPREKRKTGRAKTPAGNTFNGARFYSVEAQADPAAQASQAPGAAQAEPDSPDLPRTGIQE